VAQFLLGVKPRARASESKGFSLTWVSRRATLETSRGVSVAEGDELDPVRLLPDRVGRLLRQHAGGLVDRIDRHAVGQFADRGEEAPGWVDGKAAWLFFGRHATDRGQLSGHRIDTEAGQRAG